MFQPAFVSTRQKSRLKQASAKKQRAIRDFPCTNSLKKIGLKRPKSVERCGFGPISSTGNSIIRL